MSTVTVDIYLHEVNELALTLARTLTPFLFHKFSAQALKMPLYLVVSKNKL